MYLELEGIFNREGEIRNFDYDFSLDDELIASAVHVRGRVFNQTGIVRLEAQASYVLSAVCAKCTAPIKRQISVPVEHILISHSENEDNDLYIVVEDMHFHLDELVSEDIFLSMPSRFLCREDCKGLCSVCGADLNQGKCACAKPTDPRWDALKDLF